MARLVEIPDIIALRKVAAVIAVVRHRAVVGRMVAADPTAEANTGSWNPRPQRLRFITIFPRPGSATFSNGPIFIFTNSQPTCALAVSRAEAALLI
jgi:hypothetical protein